MVCGIPRRPATGERGELSGSGAALACQFDDSCRHSGCIESVGGDLDDVQGQTIGAVVPLFIFLVPRLDIHPNLLETDVDASSDVFQMPPVCPLFQVRQHLDLQVGLRENDGTHVAPFGHDTPFGSQRPLVFDKALTHFGAIRIGSHATCNLGEPDGIAHVLAIDENPPPFIQRCELDLQAFQQEDESVVVIGPQITRCRLKATARYMAPVSRWR